MSEKEEVREVTGKQAIYAQIGELVKEMTGKRVGKSGGRQIFDTVIDAVFASAIREGRLRFNGGNGSLHLKAYQGGSRRLPNGQVTTFGIRNKLRYDQGVATTAAISNGGAASVPSSDDEIDLG